MTGLPVSLSISALGTTGAFVAGVVGAAGAFVAGGAALTIIAVANKIAAPAAGRPRKRGKPFHKRVPSKARPI